MENFHNEAEGDGEGDRYIKKDRWRRKIIERKREGERERET